MLNLSNIALSPKINKSTRKCDVAADYDKGIKYAKNWL
jgi:hypothetical protein